MAHRPHTLENKWISFCRFLNLLEPGSEVLSISKVLLWVMSFVFVRAAIVSPDNLESLITSFGALGLASGNYAFRRHLQYKNGDGPYPKDQDPSMGEGAPLGEGAPPDAGPPDSAFPAALEEGPQD